MKVLQLVAASLPLWQINAFVGIPARARLTPHAARVTSLESKRIADTPELDGGIVPTKLELQQIKNAKRDVLLPTWILPGFVRRIIRFVRSDRGNNKLIFGILKQLTGGTALQDIVGISEDIDFSNTTKKCMWFEVKKPKDQDEQLIKTFYRVFEYAPPILMTIDKDILKEKDYDEMLGKLIEPHGDMMKVSSPIECFLANAPAFCAPMPGDETTSICDLDYLKKYQVQEGTPHRYGGKAKVKDGDIIEISGVKKEDEARFKVKLAVFLNAFAVHLVVVRHAGMGHLAIYQKYLMRLTTNKSDEYRDKWKQNKSAALLMKVLTPRRTSMVNYNIQLLIGPGNSLVGRATSFTNDALTLLNLDKYEEYENMSPDRIIKDIGTSGSKGWNSACQHSWDAAQKVVNTICHDLKDIDDHSLKELAMLLWTGTFYHGFIGDFQLDNVIKGNLPFYITGKEHVQTRAYGTLSTTIGASTMTRTMDMNTLGKYFYTKEDRDAWDEYRKELTKAAKMTGIPGFTYEGAVYNAIDF